MKNNLQVQESQQTPSWTNAQAATPKFIMLDCGEPNAAPEEQPGTAHGSEHRVCSPAAHTKPQGPGDRAVIFSLC